jgi:tRNA 2-thiocytidine biosynthesis protein TtcA
VRFELVAVNLDQKQPGFPGARAARVPEARGVPFRIVEQDTYSVVKRVIPEGKTMCSLCSRLRRGALYRVAGELGATKIALGHHRDDVLATFFLNLFHGGQLKAMPAKLAFRRRQARRDQAAGLRRGGGSRGARRGAAAFRSFPCTLCGSQENLERKRIGEMLRDWERNHPGRIESILRAMTEVRPSHLPRPEAV